MIVVAGEALIDLIVHPDGQRDAVPGGGPFNTARTIGRLAGAVSFLGRLSTDPLGARLRDALVGDGVDLSMAITTDLPTTLAIAQLDEHGSADYRFDTAGTSAPGLTEDTVRFALASGPAAFHVGSLGLVLEPMAGALRVGVGEADPHTLVMLDPNCRPTAIADRARYMDRMDAILARCDVVKASVDDLSYLSPGVEPIRAAGSLLRCGVSVVLVTDGARRVTVVAAPDASTGDPQVVGIPVPVVTVVDTVGAGDAFGGAFLARWVERGLGRGDLADLDALREAVSFAVHVAGLTCQRRGADPPRRSELDWPPA